jgi:alpha-methylacyl-CoA racemase
MHHLVNRGKRSVALDLKNPDGQHAMHALLTDADALVESYRPGVMERLGFGHETILEQYPALVYASLTGYGSTGPLAAAAGHDINFMALSGLLDRISQMPGESPQLPSINLADLVGGGLMGAIGILASLIRARTTGLGSWVETALADGVALLPSSLVADVLATGTVPDVSATGRPYYSIYDLADGRVAVGASENKFWTNLCTALGEGELIPLKGDPARQEELRDRLARKFQTMTREQVDSLGIDCDACIMSLHSLPEALESSYATHRGLTTTVEGAAMRVLSAPFVIDGARPTLNGSAPLHGEHSLEILLGAGLDPTTIARMASAGSTIDGSRTSAAT